MERFGRYELIRKIATGGMAEIYLARQAGIEGFEKLLVLKRILPHLAENEEFVEMFLHEARVAVRLNHPNVVTIFDLGKTDGSYFIAMEYIHGDDARRVWKRADEAGNPIPVPLACRIVMDAAAGLDYAHKKCGPSGEPLNIIHRDVSPQNILVSFEGAVKVVDFGIAKAADQASNTRTGVLKGKYSYMSPEQAGGHDIDQRTDQFALGVVLHELLTSKRLFKRGNDIQTLAAVSECKVLPPSELSPRVPKDLDAIVLKALARNPEDRYRDLGELQMALEEWLVANRHPASPAHLSAFMKSIYADRLAREQESGAPVFASDGNDSSSSAVGGRARRTGLSNVGGPNPTRAARPTSRSSVSAVSRAGGSSVSRRGQLAPQPLEPAPPPVEDPGADDFEPTPVDGGEMTGSSVSRLVDRISGRKKAAIGVGAVAALAAAAAVLLMLPQGNTTTTRTTVDVPVAVPAEAPKLAGLKIVTNPPGAQVYVDAKARGTTPATVDALALGDHQVFVQLDGYLDSKRTITLAREGVIEPMTFDLRRDETMPRLVQVKFESVPPGAVLTVDGRAAGRTPETVELAAGKAVEVELARDGYQPVRQTFTPDESLNQRKIIELDRRGTSAASNPSVAQGTVVLDCEPKATVWEGTRQLGETPLEVKLPAGRHQLTLVNQQEKFEHVLPVVLKGGDTVTRNLKFERGEVLFVVKPWADVYLRGRKLGTTPMGKLSLPEGDYMFTLVNTELGTKKAVPVSIRPNQLEKQSVDMAEE